MTNEHIRIYTRTGDDGTTALVGGVRVPKSDGRIEAYGTFDELNCVIGLAKSVLDPAHELQSVLVLLQNELFTVCAEVASMTESTGAARIASIPVLRQEQIVQLERTIDHFDNVLPSQHSFILPGGTTAAAFLHVARTVCRRAERALVSLAKEHVCRPELLAYVNRLSDLLYVLARYVNFKEEKEERAPTYASG